MDDIADRLGRMLDSVASARGGVVMVQVPPQKSRGLRRYQAAAAVIGDRYGDGFIVLSAATAIIALMILLVVDGTTASSSMMAFIAAILAIPGACVIAVLLSRWVVAEWRDIAWEADRRLERETIQTQRREIGAGQLSHAKAGGGELALPKADQLTKVES